MDEFRLDVQKVYRILKIHEVYDYQLNQYNGETGEEGHFVNYINTFLKLKTEASGYPGWVRSPKDEDRYVESCWQSEGISLDRYLSGLTPQNGVWLNIASTRFGEI